MGRKSSTGPKHLGSLWRKQESTHPLGEEIITLVSVLESDIEIPFICLEHWLIHKVFNGVVSTARQPWNGAWMSDCFFCFFVFCKAWDASPTDVAIVMGQFFFSGVPFLSQSTKLLIKSVKLSNMTSIEYSAQCHVMFQQRLFFVW